MHGCLEAGFGVGFSHGVACHLQGFQQQSLTRSRDMRKESVFDGIILRTVRRIVRHAEFQAQMVRQLFEMILENVAIGSVAPATIEQEQHSASVGIGRATMRFPPIRDAVASESAGVVAQTQIQVPEVSLEVVESVRKDHPERGAGKIVVERFLGLSGVEAADAKQKAKEFLVFSVHADDGTRRIHKLGSVVCDDLELPIAESMLSQRQGFASLATTQTMPFQELRDDGDADAKAEGAKLVGNLSPGKIGPENAILVGIASGAWIDDLQESFVQAGKERQAGAPAAPFFLAWPTGTGEVGFRSSCKPR
jgi:hypothetical protein